MTQHGLYCPFLVHLSLIYPRDATKDETFEILCIKDVIIVKLSLCKAQGRLSSLKMSSG